MATSVLEPAGLATRIAREVGGTPRGVGAVLSLLEEGATVPFIARYRKEASGALDEVQIRAVAERAAYFRELEDRRAFVLRTIEEQGKLTDALRERIARCSDKTELEDLYLPYKKKKKTKASLARERGLEPLAERVLEQPRKGDLQEEARAFVDPGRDVPDADAAIAGALDIVVDVVAEHAQVRAYLREAIATTGILKSTGVKKRMTERTKFEDYYDFSESLQAIPSHRYFAIARGEAEGILRIKVEIDDERALREIRTTVGLRSGTPFALVLNDAIEEAYRRRLLPSLSKESRNLAGDRAEASAIDIFAENLGHLLMAAPFGGRPVLAIDPGLRTGCKCAALDRFGQVVEHLTIYPFKGEKERPKAAEAIVRLVRKHGAAAVAVGNGTGGRETESLARMAMKVAKLSVPVVSINEAGASVYSASDTARDELGEFDITVRGAVSIGRRLQDPLAELVKIDPKSIGVGQYQHDVDGGRLGKKLNEVVESCVNQVGVELTTASPSLLRFVSGIGPKIASAIVAWREGRGFKTRSDLLKVKGLGQKAYEQCVGFLRLRESPHPLDASAVHPERYVLVEKMAADLDLSLKELIGNKDALLRIDIRRYVDDDVGEPTLKDILRELEKPGRDPRAEFEAARFRDDVQTVEDLETGMRLEGIVTNVTAFGAFVDIGVHQDGLIHVSQLADHFVKDPRDVVKVGDRVRVTVLDIDLERRRIALSRKQA